MDQHMIALAAITLLAATINGALGYGFSSITVPLALLFLSNRVLNPPLAIMLNNQGFAKKEFRAALGVVRLAESSLTAIAYIYAGLFVRPSFALLPWILPSVAIGVPFGAVLIRQMRAETFRRICMSF